MKTVVQRTGAAYKVQAGVLSETTLDRAQNATHIVCSAVRRKGSWLMRRI